MMNQFTILCHLCLAVFLYKIPISADQSQKSDGQVIESQGENQTSLKFDGMTVDRKARTVDLEATICLDEGPLELIACSQGTKEHESIVAITVPPRFVHLGLLLLGTQNGAPAMRQVIERRDDAPAWIDLPPSGDPIIVSLLVKDGKGKTIERPIGDFVKKIEASDDSNASTFRSEFLFAGSHIIPGQKTNEKEQDQNPGQYMADLQGNVISISTFGDEVLCLPFSNSGSPYSKSNQSLMWHANPDTLPGIGTKVTLRLKPKKSRATLKDAIIR